MFFSLKKRTPANGMVLAGVKQRPILSVTIIEWQKATYRSLVSTHVIWRAIRKQVIKK